MHNEKKSLIDNFSDKEILDIYKKSKNITDFSNQLGYKTRIKKSWSYVINRLNSIGIDIETLSQTSKNTKIIYMNANQNNKYCSVCNSNISYKNKSGMCKKCLKEKQDAEKIDNWLKTGSTGYSVSTTIRGCIRRYIYEDQQGKCAICGMQDTWNNKKINFILDHIDGNAANNNRSNMRLICPNCDSQLDTYKSKNKNSARNFRNEYNKKYTSKIS